ncbi:phage tail assembly protein [Gracilibacillus sp. YIM 98692]|uniref:phage tail assembly protein n=1 Tax=Gracilibacillus sp. YIM 98692 TaxID=2663532 RepID=UPI0013D4999F|nr:phage tail assembly protein [Gracilibacillus sp. YIM 98692]
MSDLIITFKKPYKFEGEEYKKVDLSGIENLSTRDLVEADKQFNTSGQMAIMNEMTTGYSLIIASKASGHPVEFFEQLPAGEGLKVKNRVMGFLNA